MISAFVNFFESLLCYAADIKIDCYNDHLKLKLSHVTFKWKSLHFSIFLKWVALPNGVSCKPSGLKRKIFRIEDGKPTKFNFDYDFLVIFK